jgi:hypothetical protein
VICDLNFPSFWPVELEFSFSLFNIPEKTHTKSGARKSKQLVLTQKVRCKGFSTNQHFSKNKGMYYFIIKSIAKQAIDFILIVCLF